VRFGPTTTPTGHLEALIAFKATVRVRVRVRHLHPDPKQEFGNPNPIGELGEKFKKGCYGVYKSNVS
jgi:hypothetical protein